ncbi:hypothetical protein M758_5G169700 [Ceratodon purpureus]|nr:hypothetical protein M758_5G169700 [Ceratodon purpureus]KAG0617170.1 hypothetical protein M758_5G169700 [Ceratodon purpureus]
MAPLSSPLVACNNLSGRLESVELNREKCALLLSYLNRVRDFYCSNAVRDSAKREFQEAVERAQHLFDESSDRKWLLKAVELWECSEHFVELFVDLFRSAQIMALPKEVSEFTREKEKLLNDRAVLLQTENDIDKSTLGTRVRQLLDSGSLEDDEEQELAHLLNDRFENLSSWYPPMLTSSKFYLKTIYWSMSNSSSKRGQEGVIVLSTEWVYGKKFAVKRFHPDAGYGKSFKHEFDILDKHRSPYIVGVVGYWELEPVYQLRPWHHVDTLCPFLLMEAMDYNLEDLICRYRKSRGGQGFSALETIKLMLPISKALRFLHAKGVVHRDIKLRNIMCSNIASGQFDNFIVKLIDFGEATDISKFSFGQRHGRAGTTGFMDPELCKPEGCTDLKRADVFSFTRVFVELLTWRSPWEEGGIQPGKEVQYMLNLDQRPTLPDDLPQKVRRIVETCWSVDADMRPTFDDICLMLQNAKLLILDPNFGEGRELFPYRDATFVTRYI